MLLLCHTFFFKFISLFLFLAVLGLRFCARAFLQLWQAGATLHRGARASHYRGLSCCGAQAPDAQAQQLWLTGLVALRHVGSSHTRAQTRVPCISRQILNHCATREALCHTTDLQLKEAVEILHRIQIINMSNENNKNNLLQSLQSFLPSILSDELSSFAFPLGSWLFAHL